MIQALTISAIKTNPYVSKIMALKLVCPISITFQDYILFITKVRTSTIA